MNDLKERRIYWTRKEEVVDPTWENSLWDRLWTCRNTEYVTVKIII